MTGFDLYEEVWAIAQGILKTKSKFHKRTNLWWSTPNWKKFDDDDQEFKKGLKPFVLKMVDR